MMKYMDNKSYEDFFVRHFNELVAYANAILWDKAKSEDIVQDVFLKYWEKQEGIKIHSSTLSYFYTSIKNRCFNYLEHLRVERQSAILLQENVQEDEEDDGVEQKREQVRIALDKLPLQCKRVVILSCIEGMTYNEVAKELNITINTVRTHISRAYAFLRRSLDAGMILIFCPFS